MNAKNFFAELKRLFEIPNWAVRLVVILLIIGFPVALILAWAFELTPEGIKRVEDVGVSKSSTRSNLSKEMPAKKAVS